MFYYKRSKNPRLEVRIMDNYTIEDVQRILFFIEAMQNSSKAKIVFDVTTAAKEMFLSQMSSRKKSMLYPYTIQSTIA